MSLARDVSQMRGEPPVLGEGNTTVMIHPNAGSILKAGAGQCSGIHPTGLAGAPQAP